MARTVVHGQTDRSPWQPNSMSHSFNHLKPGQRSRGSLLILSRHLLIKEDGGHPRLFVIAVSEA
jgi:hypothetical protein